MSTPTIEPIRDAQGFMRPDLDFRDVPARVMAAYLGIQVETLWRRTLKGVYREGVITAGKQHLYRPRVIVGDRK